MKIPLRSPLQSIGALAMAMLLVTATILGAGWGGLRTGDAAVPQALQTAVSGVQAYGLVSDTQGWLVMNNQLYWSTDLGSSWGNITPPGGTSAAIASVFFLDERTGWVVMITAGQGDPLYSLARTQDGGASWQTYNLTLFPPGDLNALAEDVSMEWVDARTGWLVIKRATGSNFSLGTLFRTTDGGVSWSRVNLPIGEPVTFSDARHGWVAGGPAGNEFYHTTDGGLTWQSLAIGAVTSGPGENKVYLLPEFEDSASGLLPVMLTDGNYARMEFFTTRDGGATWSAAGSVVLDGNVDLSIRPPLTLFDASRYVMVVPYGDRIVTGDPETGTTTRYNRDYLAQGITSLAMADPLTGWALHMVGDCSSAPDTSSEEEPKGDMLCVLRKRLLRTTSGGETWDILRLPGASGELPALQQAPQAFFQGVQLGASLAYSTSTLVGHAFDKCEISTLSQMQRWWSESPYAVVNLYIGGSARACANSLLSSTFVSQLFDQGWRFIPTWVGPQAPCTSFRSRMSYDTATAYNQGVAEANAAIQTAAALGLTDPAQGGTIVYYDLEAYNTGSATCRSAVQSFMSGWTSRMAATGNQSGVYGSVCGSALADFASLPKPADAIWLAWWTTSVYNASASLWGAPCLSDSLWANHQRIRQYAGAHNETWGGITFNIDSNVMDGILAIPYRDTGGVLAPSLPSGPKPVDRAILARTTDIWLYWTTTGSTCDIHWWGGNSDRTQTGNCSSLRLGQLRGGAYSWQVTATNTYGTTIGPVWTFDVRPHPPTNLSAVVASATQVDLAWTLSADEPADVDGYDVYINGQLIESDPQGTNNAVLDGLLCETAYSIYVRTRRQNVQSVNSNAVSVTTSSCVGGTPTFTPTGPTATASATRTPTATATPTPTASSTPTGAFGKISPANGASGLPGIVLLSWSPSVGAVSYNVCFDTLSNDRCDTLWINVSTTNYIASGLDPTRVYSWQVVAVKPPGAVLADGGTWWTFSPSGSATVTGTASPTPTRTPTASASLPATSAVQTVTRTPTFTASPTSGVLTPFYKAAPANGTTGHGTAVTLTWTPSSGATTYLLCYDLVNNNQCDSAWTIVPATGTVIFGLQTPSTYYWQVQAIRAPSTVYADGGLWWSFSTGSAPLPPSATASFTPLVASSVTPTRTASATPTRTASATPTRTVSPTPTRTASLTLPAPAASATFTASPSPLATGDLYKLSPLNGVVGVPTALVMSWSAVSGALSYNYCVDLIQNNFCDTTWTNTAGTTALVTGMVPGTTYYWQVVAIKPPGALLADGGVWWSFTTTP